MKKGKRYFPGNTKIKYLCLILAIVLFLAAIPWDSSLISALAEDGLESVLQGGTESTQQGPSEVIGEEPTETEEESTEDGELSEDETEELEDELVQPASEDAGVKTVFFDTSGNGGWNGWNKDSTMYIYRIGVDTGPNEMERVDSGIFALDADFSGVLWKYTVPAECAGVIFSQYPVGEMQPARRLIFILQISLRRIVHIHVFIWMEAAAVRIRLLFART